MEVIIVFYHEKCKILTISAIVSDAEIDWNQISNKDDGYLNDSVSL